MVRASLALEAAPGQQEEETVLRRSRAALRTARSFLRSSLVGRISVTVIAVVVLMAVFADWLAPYQPLETDYASIEVPPTAGHLMGTDHLGRDVLSRVIHGARVTLTVGLISVVLADSIGFLWGLFSGYATGRFDMVSQRVLDVLMAFPSLILAMLLLVGLGPGMPTVIIAIAFAQVPLSTRVIRSTALAIREMAYVEAARTSGATPLRIALRHVAPQAIAPLLVIGSYNLGTAIFAEAALSFLGLGIPPPTPTWGNMLGGVLADSFRPPWWMVIIPGLAITMTILASNLLGDALRDFLDPRMKEVVH
jgi:peptide/nickel transport system permease protein